MTDMGYTFFLVCFYLMAGGLLVVVVLCFWVLDIASMSLFLIALDCQYFPNPNQFYNQEFPAQACFKAPHIIHALVAVFTLLIFVPLATVFQMADMELNPLSKNLMATGHSKVEVQSFLLRVLMTFSSVFITNVRWLSIFFLVLSLGLVWLYVQWVPHMSAMVNHIRTGSYAAILYCSVLLLVVAFTPGAQSDVEAAQMQRTTTLALWVGLIPAALVGALLSWLRSRHFSVVVLRRFRDAPPGAKPHHLYRFTDAREVEILSRCCRCWVEGDDELLDAAAVALAETVLKPSAGAVSCGHAVPAVLQAGLVMLSKDPMMVILYSSFLIDVQSSYQSGYTQLQGAKRLDPSFLERFAIFSREQQHTQQSSGAEGGAGASRAINLVSYVEYQKNLRLVIKSHREALLALRQFWTHLMHSHTSLNHLTEDVRNIDATIRQADAVYKMVLSRHAANVSILRLFAKFLEQVKHDPWQSAKWLAEAEKLEQAEEDAKNGNMFSELGLDPGTLEVEDLPELLNMRGGILGGHDTRAVFVINALGIVQLTNPTVQRMFGYTKSEIKGKNINCIIPPPFSENHNSFVRNYVTLGKCLDPTAAAPDLDLDHFPLRKETLIGKHNEFVALHKERHVFGVTLHVTKISGIGEDMLFLGVVQALSSEPGMARVWVMLGSEAVVCVDPAFTDMSGFRSEELLGSQLEDWLLQPEPIASIFQGVRESEVAAARPKAQAQYIALGHHATAQQNSPVRCLHRASLDQARAAAEAIGSTQQKWVLRNVLVRHHFADPLSCDVTISPGAIGSYKFLVF
ncbi:hypothetical protein QJQ45_023173, partial [Haematococcus lacustris]